MKVSQLATRLSERVKLRGVRLSPNAMAESVNALFKTELYRNPAVLATVGGHWKGLDDLEIATCAWVSWFNEDRLHGELNDRTPSEVEVDYAEQSRAYAA